MDNQLLLDLVKNNAEHIRIINAELGAILSRLAVVETQLDMLTKMSFLVLSLVTALVVEKIFKHVFSKGGK